MDIILSWIHQGFSAIFAFVMLLGLLIFVHELGHFAVAKWCGVRVEVFSLGFGKKILSYKKGDTTYCISLIPLGGYVKMFGDEINAQLSESEKKFSFTHKTVWQRIAIVLAGPMMNFFFAILIFAVVAMLGEEVRAPLIGDINPKSVAFEAGLRPGDKVVQVGSSTITNWDEFQKSLNKYTSQTVDVRVLRTGFENGVTVPVKPELRPNPNLLSLDENIGDLEGLTFLSKSPVVGIRSGTPADKAGLKTGDKILKINGAIVKHYRDLDTMLLPYQNQEVVFDIDRPKSPGSEEFEKTSVAATFNTFASISVLGFEGSELYLFKVIPESPAEKAGLRPGDRILKIGTVEPTVWEEVLNTVKGYKGDGPLEFTVLRGSENHVFRITPEMTSHMNVQGSEEKRFTIGIVPWILIATPDSLKLDIGNPVAALARGAQRTWDVSVMTLLSFVRLIENKISPRNIGGVISIGQAAHETLKMGLMQYLTMMGAISVNLFVLNLLPIPVLDGGHLLFYTVEALKGSPMNMRKMEIAQQIGLFVLMSLMVFALFNDFSRIFGFW